MLGAGVETEDTNALLDRLESELPTVQSIPVHLSYEIIRLFSEGLYQSPQKAIEELVSNSYDAGASSAHVLLPVRSYEAETEPADMSQSDSDEGLSPLWVIDDGQV